MNQATQLVPLRRRPGTETPGTSLCSKVSVVLKASPMRQPIKSRFPFRYLDAIWCCLARGEAAVKELAEPFHVTLPAITKHLKVLERAGLIERSRSAQRRPCKLRAKPLKEAASWIDRYRTFWEESLGRLDDYLKELQSTPDSNPVSSSRKKSAAECPPITSFRKPILITL